MSKTLKIIFASVFMVAGFIIAVWPYSDPYRATLGWNGNWMSFLSGGICFIIGLFILFRAIKESNVSGKIIAGILVAGLVYLGFRGAKFALYIDPSSLPDPTITPIVEEYYLNEVCKGEGLEQAASYQKSDGIHPILFYNTENLGAFSSKSYPGNWMASSISDLQLVGCVKKAELKTIETCEYQSGYQVVRQQQYFAVDIYEAKTAKLVVHKVVPGEVPEFCPDKEEFNSYETTKYITTDFIPELKIISGFAEWVNP